MVTETIQAGTFNNPFTPSAALQTSLGALGGTSTLLQSYANTVLAQADVHLDVLPDMPAVQQSARKQARNFLDDITPQIIGVTGDVIDFGNTFTSYYGSLYPLARELQNGDRSRVDTLTNGLGHLLALAERKQLVAEELVRALKSYEAKIESTQQAVKEAHDTVEEQVKGSTGSLAQLGQQLKDLDSQMSKDLTQIAVGAATSVIGVGLIAVGALMTLPTGFTSGAVVLAGLTAVTGSAAVVATASADYDSAVTAYFDTMTKVGELESEIVVFDTVAAQIDHFLNKTDNAGSAAEQCASLWSSTADSYKSTIEGPQSGGVDSFLTTRLSAAQARWEEMVKFALQIQLNGRLGFTTKQITQAA